MKHSPAYPKKPFSRRSGWWLLFAAFAVTLAVYWSGLSGSWLFDDYPNIVENDGVHPTHASMATLVTAALSSPSSEFKRPMASLSFAVNYLISGLDPYGYKLFNIIVHLLNGLLVFILSGSLLQVVSLRRTAEADIRSRAMRMEADPEIIAGDLTTAEIAHRAARTRSGRVAALIAAAWMLLPINLTSVLYVVQRMESMANLFVLLGLIGYVAGRRAMLATGNDSTAGRRKTFPAFCLSTASLILGTVVGALAKETAVMLPLYAVLIEWLLFGFRAITSECASAQPSSQSDSKTAPAAAPAHQRDRRVIALFALLLGIPMVLGLIWLLPGILNPATWATRDFTLGTRLLSEARIVSGYVLWTLIPAPGSLSFYHDNFLVSTGLLTPWTTLASILFIGCLLVLVWWLRQREPLVAAGIALFLGCQLLTGTILPLELIYEHRNYFASFALLLALVPMLAAPAPRNRDRLLADHLPSDDDGTRGLPMPLARYALLGGLMTCWTVLTALTAYAWGNPLRLAQDLASRAPDSPRAEYELGRTYIIYSHYDPASPFTHLAYAPLERAATLPDSSILPEQALIFMNSRMHLPIKEAWWNSMIPKLKRHKPGVQDESSLAALTDCMRREECNLSKNRMTEAYLAALSHPGPSARLVALYADFAWNLLEDHNLGESMISSAVKLAPNEPAYRITQVRMLAAQSKRAQAVIALAALKSLNYGGRLDNDISQLRRLQELQ